MIIISMDYLEIASMKYYCKTVMGYLEIGYNDLIYQNRNRPRWRYNTSVCLAFQKSTGKGGLGTSLGLLTYWPREMK
jgi:hypothetical protein